jgi:RTX calcium-binding nonapeptide repeat (4 copies)
MRAPAVRRDPAAMPRLPIALALAALTAAAAAPAAVHAAPISADEAARLCAPAKPGEQCGPGNGRRTSGGGAKVTHAGWPAVTGILWKVLDSGDHDKAGGDANDELLGHHGSDALDAGPGDDILWGDWDPADNDGAQRDTLLGGAGDDFIYPSHGTTKVRAGAGDDFVWAYYGKGTIDCGPGKDTARVRMNGAFTLKRCEKVLHW